MSTLQFSLEAVIGEMEVTYIISERLDAVCSPEYIKKLEAGDVDIRLLHSKYRRRAWEIWTAWSVYLYLSRKN